MDKSAFIVAGILAVVLAAYFAVATNIEAAQIHAMVNAETCAPIGTAVCRGHRK